MKIGTPKETFEGENRVAMTPESALQLQKLGHSCMIEAGAGEAAGFSNDKYVEAGVEVIDTAAELWETADVVAKVRVPNTEEMAMLRSDQTLISFFSPVADEAKMKEAAEKGTTVVAMEMIPRISRAQKMDALSSMANIAGYRAVIEAGNNFGRFFTGQITAAGKVPPAKVLVVGAGVAGLQAIATAKRLGAKVVAFDTRDVVAEQVRSLGGKFLEIDLGETGQTKDGYAVELTEEQRQLQLEGQKKQIAESDIVITTAQVFGRKPPVLVTKDMVAGMKPGSVIVDMAAETGGNVEGSVAGETVEVDGVTIIGNGNWANYVSRDASQMYSSNLFNLVDEGWDKEKQAMVIDFENDILQGCVITHSGEIVNDTIKNLIK